MDNKSSYFEKFFSNINSANMDKDIESKIITTENIKEHNLILKNLFNLAVKENFSFTITKITRSKTKVSIFSDNSDDFHFFIKIKNIDNLIKDLWFSIKKIFLKLQKFNPVIGTDGVGKTTIIENLVKEQKRKIKSYRFKRTYRKSLLYKLFQSIFWNRTEKKLGGKIDKNQFDDYFGKIIFYISIVRFRLISISNIFTISLKFSDRFFYDYFFKNIRFEEKKTSLRSHLEKMIDLTPDVNILIHLYAAYETIAQRKETEFSKEDINFYTENIFEFYLIKSAMIYTFINTSIKIKDSVELIYKSIDLKE